MSVPKSYKAYVAQKDEEGKTTCSLTTRSIETLSQGEVTIKVAYSSLNYKDALSASGNVGVTKHYPHVPGIDAAGEVVASDSSLFSPGDKVLVTGYDLGSNSDGGFAELVRTPASWVVPLPPSITLKESMIFGTAGFTAALCVESLLRNGAAPNKGEVLVTGATGGVGSIAVALLAKEGFSVTASTGKQEVHSMLKNLGATTIINRDTLIVDNDAPLLKSRFQGAIDTVGGKTLETVLRSIALQGSVSACGLVGGNELHLTVFPFILRGVNLQGIDSMHWPMGPRREIWRKLSQEWKLPILESFTTTIGLEQLDEYIQLILGGQIQGRIIVKVNSQS